MKNSDLIRKATNEQKANYYCKVTDEWNNYYKTINKDFFDTNKLYLKSVQDYKNRKGLS